MSAPAHIIRTMVPPHVDEPAGAEMLGRLAAALAISAREWFAAVSRSPAAPALHRQEPARRA